MKFLVFLTISTAIIIFSCNTQKEQSSLISKDNLLIEKFTINTERDTVLQTENGALLKIPANTLENKNGKSITLEIKEAYSIEQIIRAGLFTQSNGQPLSSGGMIYINTTAGREVTFKQKIQVAMPTNYLQKGMQLYKGEQKNDGSINWNNPDTLPENKQLTSVEKGKILFESNCTSCHAIGKDMTGPDLAHIEKRFETDGEEGDWDYCLHYMEYVHKTQHYRPDTSQKHTLFDPVFIYKCNVRAMFGSLGTFFPGLTWESRQDIYNYIQNESDRLNLPLPSYAYLKDCADSCEAYNEKTYELRKLKNLSLKQREKLITDNGKMTVVNPDSIYRTSDTIGFNRKVSKENFNATYYQFTIDSFGWYNIDILLKQMNGVEESQLFVRISGEYRERVNIFLIIPSVKVYGEGGPTEAGDGKYAFFKPDGTIPLPQHAKAFILAVTEQDGKIAYSLKEFTTGLQQEFDIELHSSTKEQFEAALKEFDTNRLHIKVDKTKNADSIIAKDKEIRNIDAQLKEAEKLKPKGCDCDCGDMNVADSSKSREDFLLMSN